VVQQWLSQQADIELTDWPPQAPHMNPIKNMWSEVKNTMQVTWPDISPRKRNTLLAGHLCQTLGMKLLCLNVIFYF
jgi:hypothetical protein